MQQLDEGALTQRTFDWYEQICDTIAETTGKHGGVDAVRSVDLATLQAVLGKAKSGKPVSVNTLRRRLTFARMPFRMANEDMGCSVRYKKALRSPAAVWSAPKFCTTRYESTGWVKPLHGWSGEVA